MNDRVGCRYYIAAKPQRERRDLDFNPDDFVGGRVNSDLIGKYVNIASRAASSLRVTSRRAALLTGHG